MKQRCQFDVSFVTAHRGRRPLSAVFLWKASVSRLRKPPVAASPITLFCKELSEFRREELHGLLDWKLEHVVAAGLDGMRQALQAEHQPQPVAVSLDAAGEILGDEVIRAAIGLEVYIGLIGRLRTRLPDELRE